ncbi:MULTISPECIES: DUF7345 domain-containing protein [Salinibaculum]|uniref:DUF7345 domain-containing protein n=1 Tax=Salinibaculum TaxID=2732368 RepID=UPI0030CC4F5F
MTDESRTQPLRRAHGRHAALLVVVALLVTVPVAGAAGGVAQQTADAPPAEPGFVVDLASDGSARVTLATAFDLTTDSERAAFEQLRANSTLQERRTAAFATRMESIADRAEAETGRSMAVRDSAMTFATENETGIVALSVTWDGLAAGDGDRLRVSDPFDSQFSVDRPFRLVGPAGYDLATVQPSPATRTQSGATWRAGTDFDGFETTFAPAGTTATDSDTPTAGTDTPGERGPGFGLWSAALALVAFAALLATRRRGSR